MAYVMGRLEGLAESIETWPGRIDLEAVAKALRECVAELEEWGK